MLKDLEIWEEITFYTLSMALIMKWKSFTIEYK